MWESIYKLSLFVTIIAVLLYSDAIVPNYAPHPALPAWITNAFQGTVLFTQHLVKKLLPPNVAMLNDAKGHITTQLTMLVHELDIVDLFDKSVDGRVTSTDIAGFLQQECNEHLSSECLALRDNLESLLIALSETGIFKQVDPGFWSHTSKSRLLSKANPYTLSEMYNTLAEFHYITDKFNSNFRAQQKTLDYLAKPLSGRHRALARTCFGHSSCSRLIATEYPWARAAAVITDLSGGSSDLYEEILMNHPSIERAVVMSGVPDFTKEPGASPVLVPEGKTPGVFRVAGDPKILSDVPCPTNSLLKRAGGYINADMSGRPNWEALKMCNTGFGDRHLFVLRNIETFAKDELRQILKTASSYFRGTHELCISTAGGPPIWNELPENYQHLDRLLIIAPIIRRTDHEAAGNSPLQSLTPTFLDHPRLLAMPLTAFDFYLRASRTGALFSMEDVKELLQSAGFSMDAIIPSRGNFVYFEAVLTKYTPLDI